MITNKWEYRIIVLSYQDPPDRITLNFEGLEGWELVTILPSTHTSYPKAYFKRFLAK